jgi:Tfp pilus assembly protein PilE
MYKKNEGITLIALVITIIIMLILVGVGIKLGNEAINKAKLEDLKTNMISIKTKAKTIEEKYMFGDSNLVGKEISDTDSTTQGIQNSDIKGGVLNELNSSNNNLEYVYKWDEEILSDQGLDNIKLDDGNYYIVCYDIDHATCEVFYSQGYNYKGNVVYGLANLE